MNVSVSAHKPAVDEAITLREPTEVDPAQVHSWMQAGEVLLVDVREASEFENERIPGALLMPLSFFDGQNFPRLPGLRVVLHCAVGKRSAAAAKQLLKAGFGEGISMRGGLNAWKAEGFAVEN
ncbi:MAG: rhodanese-like domain-containing protein [Magnetospirillum sp. WYHS-4]